MRHRQYKRMGTRRDKMWKEAPVKSWSRYNMGTKYWKKEDLDYLEQQEKFKEQIVELSKKIGI
jgi:hypothetical protein